MSSGPRKIYIRWKVDSNETGLIVTANKLPRSDQEKENCLYTTLTYTLKK